MADFVTKEKRSNIMRGVRSKNTRPEVRVRALLHRRGFRFSLHRKDLPGKPDICLRKYGAVVLVHGCFWHHHTGCSHGRIPDSNRAFWEAKILRTRERDLRDGAALEALGWRVVTVWECELADEALLVEHLEGELKAL